MVSGNMPATAITPATAFMAAWNYSGPAFGIDRPGVYAVPGHPGLWQPIYATQGLRRSAFMPAGTKNRENRQIFVPTKPPPRVGLGLKGTKKQENRQIFVPSKTPDCDQVGRQNGKNGKKSSHHTPGTGPQAFILTVAVVDVAESRTVKLFLMAVVINKFFKICNKQCKI